MPSKLFTFLGVEIQRDCLLNSFAILQTRLFYFFTCFCVSVFILLSLLCRRTTSPKQYPEWKSAVCRKENWNLSKVAVLFQAVQHTRVGVCYTTTVTKQAAKIPLKSTINKWIYNKKIISYGLSLRVESSLFCHKMHFSATNERARFVSHPICLSLTFGYNLLRLLFFCVYQESSRAGRLRLFRTHWQWDKTKNQFASNDAGDVL